MTETLHVRWSHGVIPRTRLSASHRGARHLTGSASSLSPMTVRMYPIYYCLIVYIFIIEGVVYNECTTAGLGQAWCSVSTWPNGTHKAGQGLYGLCPATCPGAGGTCRPGSTWKVRCDQSDVSRDLCNDQSCAG